MSLPRDLRAALGRLFGAKPRPAPALDPVTGKPDLGPGSAAKPDAIERLWPLIAPFGMLSAPSWIGPLEPLPLPRALTWAVREPGDCITYLTHEGAALFEARGIDWKARALENLRRGSEALPYSGYKLGPDGRPFMVSLLHPDGFGPSRLLLPGLFEKVFPEGYLVAVPERTCAVLYRRDLAPDEQAVIERIIDGCFREGTDPITPERFAPEVFWG